VKYTHKIICIAEELQPVANGLYIEVHSQLQQQEVTLCGSFSSLDCLFQIPVNIYSKGKSVANSNNSRLKIVPNSNKSIF